MFQKNFNHKAKGSKWDGFHSRSNFKKFEISAKDFHQAVKSKNWLEAKRFGDLCLQIDVSDFSVKEIGIYNVMIFRIQNGVKTIPQLPFLNFR